MYRSLPGSNGCNLSHFMMFSICDLAYLRRLLRNPVSHSLVLSYFVTILLIPSSLFVTISLALVAFRRVLICILLRRILSRFYSLSLLFVTIFVIMSHSHLVTILLRRDSSQTLHQSKFYFMIHIFMGFNSRIYASLIRPWNFNASVIYGRRNYASVIWPWKIYTPVAIRHDFPINSQECCAPTSV